jgi:predicted N-acetyltransferase YhbS
MGASMSGPLVRLAEPRDDDAVGELLVSAFVERYRLKLPEVVVTERRKSELRDVAAKRAVARVWVAELDGALVGTVALWPPGAEGSEAWLAEAADLRHLAVAIERHGRGVAGALLDTAEAFARAERFTAVCLHVRRGATGVRRLYEGRGYLRAPEGDLDLLPEVYLEAFALQL